MRSQLLELRRHKVRTRLTTRVTLWTKTFPMASDRNSNSTSLERKPDHVANEKLVVHLTSGMVGPRCSNDVGNLCLGSPAPLSTVLVSPLDNSS